MIIGFDKQTAELSVEEMRIAEVWAEGFRKRTSKEQAISASEICNRYNSRTGNKLSGARARKIISYIRTGSMVKNLLASSKGYWVSDDQKEIDAYICSLDQRIKAIENVRQALINQQAKPVREFQKRLSL